MPRFTEVASTANRVIVGTVLEAVNSPSATPVNYGAFRFRVDAIIRGNADQVLTLIAVRTKVPFDQPDGVCPEIPIIYVNTGDVIAIAFGGRMDGVSNPVNTAAWIEGEPSVLDRGAQQLTLAQVRRAAAVMPETSTLSPLGTSDSGMTSIGFALGIAGAAWTLYRLRPRGEPEA